MSPVRQQDINYDPESGLYLLGGQPFSGSSERRHPNGSIACQMEFVSGAKHGTCRDFFPGGACASRADYLGGLFHGTVQRWYRAGVPKSEQLYELGSLRAERAWSEGGVLQTESASNAAGRDFRAMKRRFPLAPPVPTVFADTAETAYRRLATKA